MEAVRPDLASNSLSAWSRGVLVKPPAAAPQRMLQVGTSLSVTVHSAGLGGVGVAVGVGAMVAAGFVTVTLRVGRSVAYSAARKRATSFVTGDARANEQVPAWRTTEL